MKIKSILDEDFVNYKVPSMYIAFPFCSFKCEKDCGMQCCQNSTLAKSKIVECEDDSLIQRYLRNPITKAIVCCGLEPFDSWEDLYALISTQRDHIDTLLKIIKRLQEDMILSLECDDEDRVEIIKELIWWIDKLFKEEG